MCCYACKYLCENDKKEGKCCGALYYCSKLKKYINSASKGCDNYFKDFSRGSFTRDEIYNNGKKYYDDDKDPGVYLVILFFIIIVGIIANFIY